MCPPAADDIRNVPFYTPAGMDPRSDSPHPWELLVNIAPTEEGWEQRPGSALEYVPTKSVRWKACGALRHTDRILLVSIGATDTPGEVCILVLDDKGRKLYDGYKNLPLSIGPQLLGKESYWGVTSLGNRIFFCNKAAGVVLLLGLDTFGMTEHTTFELADGSALYMGPVEWQTGISATTWPYVTGEFSGSILCTHLNRIFYAGLEYNQTVDFHTEIPTDQTVIQGFEIDPESKDQIYVDRQSLVWTEAANPFAIEFRNFVHLGTSHRITTLASWKDKLFIFTENDIWVMSGQYEEEFSFRQVVTGIGCQHKASLAIAPEGVFFAHESGIYVTDGNKTERISAPVDFLFTPGFMVPNSAGDIDDVGAPIMLEKEYGKAAYIAGRREVWFPVKRRETGEFHYALVFSLHHMAWWLASGERHYKGVTLEETVLVALSTATAVDKWNCIVTDDTKDFTAIGVKENDLFTKLGPLGVSVRVQSVGVTTLVLKGWPGLFPVGSSYAITRDAPNCYASGYSIIEPFGDSALAFGYDEARNTETVMRMVTPGGVAQPIPDAFSPARVISARTRAAFLMVTRPLLMEQAREVYAQFLCLNWRRAPNGGYHDREPKSGAAATKSKVYMWGAEAAWGQNEQVLEHLIAPCPYWVNEMGQLSRAVWGKCKWNDSIPLDGLLTYTRRDGIFQQLPMNVRSRYVRVAIWGYGLNRALLRGIHILLRNVGATGGRQE